MAALSPALAISLNFLVPIGSFKALSTSTRGSATPGFSFGSIMPRKFLVGILAQISVFP
jgi:hypothetical protein